MPRNPRGNPCDAPSSGRREVAGRDGLSGDACGVRAVSVQCACSASAAGRVGGGRARPSGDAVACASSAVERQAERGSADRIPSDLAATRPVKRADLQPVRMCSCRWCGARSDCECVHAQSMSAACTRQELESIGRTVQPTTARSSGQSCGAHIFACTRQPTRFIWTRQSSAESHINNTPWPFVN